MEEIAIIPAKGIGDALLMMIAGSNLARAGHKVSFFHDALGCFQSWSSQITFHKKPSDIESLLKFDRLVLENDNSLFIKEIKKQCSRPVHVFYPSYKANKNLALTEEDCIFDSSKTMVDNISFACHKLFNLPINNTLSLEIPSSLKHNKYLNRVVINPTSQDPNKNWSKEKFLLLAKKLRKDGFNPVFCMSVTEKKDWLMVKDYQFELPSFPTLADFASFLFESAYFIGNDSGPGHLASYFQIPSLIVSLRSKHLDLWQPGWKKATLLMPSNWVPNFKFFRFRDAYWQRFVSVNRVYQTFSELSDSNC